MPRGPIKNLDQLKKPLFFKIMEICLRGEGNNGNPIWSPYFYFELFSTATEYKVVGNELVCIVSNGNGKKTTVIIEFEIRQYADVGMVYDAIYIEKNRDSFHFLFMCPAINRPIRGEYFVRNSSGIKTFFEELARKKREALVMASHKRLGSDSVARVLPAHLLKYVVKWL